MNVRLIAVTSSKIPECKTAEGLIVYAARVSNPNPTTENAERLLRYCLTHGHWSVFETAGATFEIETSRAISAQILRHRSFTFQEFSQRYSEVVGFESYEARAQDSKNRQSSTDTLPVGTKAWFRDALRWAQEEAQLVYEEALARGIAKECARMLLPMSTSTKLYMTGNVRSWLTYFQARCAPETQLEHREIAQAIEVLFAAEFPAVHAAWKAMGAP